MNITDISTIQRHTVIRAPRERVWKALTTLAEFGKWFGVEAEGEFATGPRLRMVSTNDNCRGLVFYVTVAEMRPPALFSWRWHPGSAQPDPNDATAPTTLVVFRLEEVASGTMVTVTETGFDRISLERRAAVYQENSAGWEYQMGALERYVGGPA